MTFWCSFCNRMREQNQLMCSECAGKFVPLANADMVVDMLKAAAKHGVSLGDYHAQVQALKNKAGWVDKYYHEIMLASMLIELFLLGTLVALELVHR